MNASMSCNPSRSADLADSPASTNSRTIRAPSSSALRELASRCAGIENPSSVLLGIGSASGQNYSLMLWTAGILALIGAVVVIPIKGAK